MANEPAKFDPEALDRILKRAAELQAGEQDHSGAMSSEELLALGRDVGIPEHHLRRAMLEVGRVEEQPAPDGLLDQVIGLAEVQAQRVVRGTPAQIERTLVDYLRDEEVFGVLRSTEGHILFEPIAGWQASVTRGMRGNAVKMQKVDRLSATVVPLEPGYCQVVLRASMRHVRRGYVGGAMALMATALGGTVVLAALHAFWPMLLLPVPGGVGVSWAVGRSYRPLTERTLLGLECALDQLDQSDARTVPRVSTPQPGAINSVLSGIAALIAGPPNTTRRPRE